MATTVDEILDNFIIFHHVPTHLARVRMHMSSLMSQIEASASLLPVAKY